MFNLLGDGARRGFEDFGVSVGRTAGFGFCFEGVGGVEAGLGIEEVTGVLALGRGMESEDITRGRGLLESMADDGQVVGGGVTADGGNVFDDDDVVWVLALSILSLGSRNRRLVKQTVGIDHVVDDAALRNLLRLELGLGGKLRPSLLPRWL